MIDNVSTRPVAVECAKIPTSVLWNRVDTGPADGNAIGLRAFLETGADAVWVMDDDCAPDPRCLATVLSEWAANTVMFPVVRDNGQGALHPRLVRRPAAENPGRCDLAACGSAACP